LPPLLGPLRLPISNDLYTGEEGVFLNTRTGEEVRIKAAMSSDSWTLN
jgi:hypothetical protein